MDCLILEILFEIIMHTNCKCMEKNTYLSILLLEYCPNNQTCPTRLQQINKQWCWSKVRPWWQRWCLPLKYTTNVVCREIFLVTDSHRKLSYLTQKREMMDQKKLVMNQTTDDFFQNSFLATNRQQSFLIFLINYVSRRQGIYIFGIILSIRCTFHLYHQLVSMSLTSLWHR